MYSPVQREESNFQHEDAMPSGHAIAVAFAAAECDDYSGIRTNFTFAKNAELHGFLYNTEFAFFVRSYSAAFI